MNFGTNEFTLLSDEQTFGSRKIDVIEQLGGKCAISDLQSYWVLMYLVIIM